MFDKLKAIQELKDQKQSYQKVINQLRNIPEDMVYVSAVPYETAEDVIKHYEALVRLTDAAIKKIKLLFLNERHI